MRLLTAKLTAPKPMVPAPRIVGIEYLVGYSLDRTSRSLWGTEKEVSSSVVYT